MGGANTRTAGTRLAWTLACASWLWHPPASAAPIDAGMPDAGASLTDAGVPADAGVPPHDFVVESPRGNLVVVVPVEGTVELGLTALVDRALGDYPDAAAVVLDINTFGGRVDAAVKIRDALIDAEVPTAAYVHRRAISAGALIALACERIAFAPAGSMGAATPFAAGGSGEARVDEKMISYMRAEMRATAEHRGRPGPIAEAMVDPDVVVKGVIAKGKTLTLDTEDALRLGVADLEAEDLDAVIAALGIDAPQKVVLQETWGERIARAVTDPGLSGILMSLGMLALAASIYSGSFGVLTLVGLAALGLFFFGHSIVHLVGWEEALLLLGGLVLIALELLVIPGFGVAGVSGILLVGASFVMSLIAHPIDVAFDVGALGEALWRVMLSFMGTVLGAAVLLRYLPRSPLGQRLVLSPRLSGSVRDDEGSSAKTVASGGLVGQRGVAEGDLRPTGRVRIEGALHDARSERSFIEPGTEVQVVRQEMGALVVRPVSVAPPVAGQSDEASDAAGSDDNAAAGDDAPGDGGER